MSNCALSSPDRFNFQVFLNFDVSGFGKFSFGLDLADSYGGSMVFRLERLMCSLNRFLVDFKEGKSDSSDIPELRDCLKSNCAYDPINNIVVDIIDIFECVRGLRALGRGGVDVFSFNNDYGMLLIDVDDDGCKYAFFKNSFYSGIGVMSVDEYMISVYGKRYADVLNKDVDRALYWAFSLISEYASVMTYDEAFAFMDRCNKQALYGFSNSKKIRTAGRR